MYILRTAVTKNKGENSYYYTLPGGAVGNGETLKAASVREIKEETGLNVELEGLSAVGEAFFEKRRHHAFFLFLKG